MKREKLEAIRRARVAAIRRAIQDRYGYQVPDDDAGRDDLTILLEAISLAPVKPREKMQAEIEIIAPWMTKEDAEQWIGDIMNLPDWYRRRPANELGARLRLTNAKREELKAWNLAPIDITAEELAEQRKAKDRARKRKRSKLTRGDYLAKSKSKLKPWEARGMSRATWY